MGRVRTLDRVVVTNGRGTYVVKGRILKQRRKRDGYLSVHFSINGKQVDRTVHRLVAQTFIPNSNNLPEVNHLDNNPLNNNISNLEWCTHEYNIAYREKYGKALNRPVYAVNLKTLEVFYFESQSKASRELEAKLGHINDVLKGRQRTAKGYWFTYADNNAVEATRAKFGESAAEQVTKLMEVQNND